MIAIEGVTKKPYKVGQKVRLNKRYKRLQPAFRGPFIVKDIRPGHSQTGWLVTVKAGSRTYEDWDSAWFVRG